MDGQRVVQASIIDPALEKLVGEITEIADVGRIGQSTFTAGGELVDASIIGYERSGPGSPDTLIEGRPVEQAGEAVANHIDAGRGFGVGDTVVIEPGGPVLVVVGLARDAQLSVTATLFVDYDTHLDAVATRSRSGVEPRPDILGVVPTEGTSAAEAVTLLRAIGADRRRLLGPLLIQVLIVLTGGLAAGTALYTLIVAADATSLSLRFDRKAVAAWPLLLSVPGVTSSAIAARRMMQIDPNDAATGGPVRPSVLELIRRPGRFATPTTILTLVAALAGVSLSLRGVLRVDPAAAIGGSS